MSKKMPKMWLQKNKEEGIKQRGSALPLQRVQPYIWQYKETLKTAFIHLERLRF